MHQAAVPVLGPGLGQQGHQPLLHRQQALVVLLAAVDLLQVAQHAGQDVPRRRRLQVQAQRHVELAGEARAALVGLEPLRQLLGRERLPGEGVHHHLALGQLHLDHEVAREAHPAGLEPQALGQLQPEHRQRDLDAPAGAQHRVDIAVVGVGEVVEIAAEAQVVEEELVERAQAVQVGRVGRDPAAQPLEQAVDLVQHLLHVEVGVLVESQAGGRLQQGKVIVAPDQGTEIVQGAGRLELPGHASFVAAAYRRVKRAGRGRRRG